ncbi:hypothetical protein GCM10027570_52150 [Streptomonospora sediminis]
MTEHTTTEPAPVSGRGRPSPGQRAFIADLYRLGAALGSGNQHEAAWARRTLALIRRSATDDRYLPDALRVTEQHGPPDAEAEADARLFTAGLFAQHPRPPERGVRRLPLGEALRSLGDSPAVEARLRQLIAADWPTLQHRLRQAVRLLSGGAARIDYGSLLADLVVLRSHPPASAEAHRVHLGWARDFRRRTVAAGAPADQPADTPDETPAAPDHPTAAQQGDPT